MITHETNNEIVCKLMKYMWCLMLEYQTCKWGIKLHRTGLLGPCSASLDPFEEIHRSWVDSTHKKTNSRLLVFSLLSAWTLIPAWICNHPVKREMKLYTHSQTSTVVPVKFYEMDRQINPTFFNGCGYFSMGYIVSAFPEQVEHWLWNLNERMTKPSQNENSSIFHES